MTPAFAVPLSRVVAEIEREPGSWTAVYCESGSEDKSAEAVVDAMDDAQAVGEGGSTTMVRAGQDLPDVVEGSSSGDVVVVVGLERMDAAALAALDLRRNRMVGGASVVLVMPEGFVPAVRRYMPNTWSLIGPRGWWVESTGSALDVDERLASLRERYGLTDDQLVAEAERGELPLDPPMVEWLVLLGRGDLLDD